MSESAAAPSCRACGSPLVLCMIDLHHSPPSNQLLERADLSRPESTYPLRAMVCSNCHLAQLTDPLPPEELFGPEYAYFSSFSSAWLEHCRQFSEQIREQLHLGSDSLVVEIASNDGYLLQFFKDAGLKVLGVEPTTNTAAAARRRGIPTQEIFFGAKSAPSILAANGRPPDLVVANNVLAHVPDPSDFVRGLAVLLSGGGVATIEFPHLLRLLEETQFDTIYHEHYSYLSLTAVTHLLRASGLQAHRVEALNTHGGSLRVHASLPTVAHPLDESVAAVLASEQRAGLLDGRAFEKFQQQAEATALGFLEFLLRARKESRVVMGYGAAAKASTLLNFCGVKGSGLVRAVADASPRKQGRYLPGSHVPIVTEDVIRRERPAYVVIFPWNLKAELTSQLAYIREWGGRFVTAVPELSIW